jgi:hypothetical protein
MLAQPAFARGPFTLLRRRLTRTLAWAGAGLSAAAVLAIVLLISLLDHL